MGNALSVRLLGPLELLVQGAPVRLRSERERTVMAVLGLNHGHTVATEEIIDAVWGEAPPKTVRNQLAICVSSLRKALSAPKDTAIATIPPGYALSGTFAATDLALARELSHKARAARTDGDLPEAARLLRETVGLWRGETLADVMSDRVRDEARWIEQWRTSLQEERLELEVRLGRHEEALGDLTRLVSDEPFRERPRALLMLALYRVGRQSEALNTYLEARELLVEELGVSPGAELQRTYQLILDSETVTSPALSPQAPPVREGPADGATGTDAPEERRAPVPDQLPPAPVGFRGRDEELDVLEAEYNVRSTLEAPVSIAVTGMGGVGKTAFALHWAYRRTDRFPDGRLYVDMSGFTEGASSLTAEEVLYDFLYALGTPREEIPSAPAERASALRSRTAGKRLLIILDNVQDSAQIRPLLTGHAGCTTLVTSRNALESLAVTHGVGHVHLAPLDDARSVEVLRAVLHRPPDDQDALLELARLCDGLPLALRITAARLTAARGQTLNSLVRRLASEQRRLAELSRGEVKLTATFALSYRTLSPDAARLFRCLGLVHSSEVPEWAMAAFLGTTSAEDALNALEELLDSHLIELVGEDRVGQPRYRVYDLLRLYARECAKFVDTDEERRAAVERFLGGWLHLLREADRHGSGGIDIELRGASPMWCPDPVEVEKCMSSPAVWRHTERHSLSRAVEHAADTGLDEFAWELAVSAMPRFLYEGQIEDWHHTHQHALRSVRAKGNRRGEAALLFSLGNARAESGEGTDAHYRKALEIFTEVGDDRGRGLVLLRLSAESRSSGDLTRALDQCLRAREAIERTDDTVGRTWVLLALSRVRIQHGDLEGARSDLLAVQEALDGDPHWPVRAHTLRRWGELRQADGDHPGAISAFTEALELARSGSDLLGQAHLLLDLAHVRLADGDDHTAHELAASSLDLARRLRNSYCVAIASRMMARIHRVQGSDEWADAYQRQASEHSARLDTGSLSIEPGLV
ncbi:hypothetical protein A6A08_19180 [Nocardiopsis sp. TSRI0078]|uniref:AfsR/SARP family transcriptional regulator n=1 Tax=unclassified Nocardiopsis TaxID=2649073 RepID=UPI0009400282|nr:BTAD domain-containing putative transcriptional regulator [Nocardiopsis sp. TSRI0078]OKI22395.1 hypothetical protein A6A08_19180 [Nocardiopsis sp. TSRI0078]